MKLRDLKSAAERRAFIQRQTNTTLKSIGNFEFDEKTASSKNCENLIGAVHIPLGIAGPLKIKDQRSKIKAYFIPLATTEGALVASVSRGCKAIFESGGSDSSASYVGTTRAPVFYTGSIEKGDMLASWITSHEDMIKKVTEKTSNHLTYLKSDIVNTPPYLFVRMYFDTGDAMGMNMVTIAADEFVRLVEKETGIYCWSVSGNIDSDKKPSWRNIIDKRGWEVRSEVILSKKTLQDTLKTSAKGLYDVWISKCMVGSALGGLMGNNAHFANILSAIFIATGQDPAHISECSSGMTFTELRGDDLYVSVYLPDLMLATVGGGTALGTQSEALSIMGISGEGHVQEFAEIVSSVVLAGELSLLASLSEGSLARAHKRLGRSKVKNLCR